MGLGIYAHENATFISDDSDPDYEGYDDELVFVPENYPEFAGREDGLLPGWYRTSGRLAHWARSYGGYNRWRDRLAKLGGYDAVDLWKFPVPSVPFFELVHFADNEGTIGPKTSAKLAKEFGDWAERAALFASGIEHGEQWLTDYEAIADLFRVASGSGVVRFQ